MTITLRASRIRSFLERRSVAAAVPVVATMPVADPWPETLARLARAHRARRIAPDPRRPWLSERSRSAQGEPPAT